MQGERTVSTRPLHIGFDLDGVLVDFNTSFLRVLQEIEGQPFGPCGDLRDTATLSACHAPTSWDWPLSYGFSPNTITAAWHHAGDPSTRFWARLRPLHSPDALTSFLTALAGSSAVVYFLTSRPGATARQQSVTWLEAHGFDAPTVCITSAKGYLAYGLQLDLVIDDQIANCANVLMQSTAHVAIVRTDYNRTWVREIQPTPRQQARIEEIPCTLGGLQAIVARGGVTL